MRTLSHLHSNMDRFERFKSRMAHKKEYSIYIPIWIDLKAPRAVLLYAILADIYIPIWIDLKAMKLAALLHGQAHLHSNMDRFERVITMKAIVKNDRIYIPIWIDLKLELNGTIFYDNDIYIPIWIDLKQDLCRLCTCR